MRKVLTKHSEQREVVEKASPGRWNQNKGGWFRAKSFNQRIVADPEDIGSNELDRDSSLSQHSCGRCELEGRVGAGQWDLAAKDVAQEQDLSTVHNGEGVDQRNAFGHGGRTSYMQGLVLCTYCALYGFRLCSATMSGMMDEGHIKPAVDSLLSQAQRLHEKGKLDEAVAILSDVRSRRPDRWEAHVGLGRIYYDRGQLREAMEVLPGALAADPRCMAAYHLIAVLGLHGGVVEFALEQLEKGAQYLPREALLFEWLVALYAVAGRDDDLTECLHYYARLRGKTLSDVALIFARNPQMPPDIRSRITAAAGF